jgi:hypothetical protein
MPQGFKAVTTKGDGNCAFHAIFGEYDLTKKEFFCENVGKKREEIANLIIDQYASSKDELLIDIINNGLYEVFIEGSSELEENPEIGTLLQLIETERKQKETDTASEINTLLEGKNLKDKIQTLVTSKNLNLPTGKENSAVNLYLLLYNEYDKAAISNLFQEETEKNILEQCYDLQAKLKKESQNLSKIIHDKLEENSELKKQVLEAIQQVISTEGKWLPQQFIAAIARVYKTIIFLNTGMECIGANKEEEAVRINFIPGHYERVMPNGWNPPPLTPSIFSPKGEENYTILAQNILENYIKLANDNAKSNISITKATTENNTGFIRQNDNKVLGTLTPNGMEFPLISTTNQEKELAIEPNEPKLLDEQQKLFISFLYSVKEDPTKEGKILTFEAKNFPPNSLKSVLEAIKNKHAALLGLIKFKLPPLDKCFYLSSNKEDGALINQQYTQNEYNEINELIAPISHKKSLHL